MDAKNRIIDKSKIIIPEGTMEDFKRPNHNDFMTDSELRAAEFSGLRRNELACQSEVWLLGDKVVTISDAELRRNPMAVNIAMQDVFHLDRVMPDTDEVHRYDRGYRE